MSNGYPGWRDYTPPDPNSLEARAKRHGLSAEVLETAIVQAAKPQKYRHTATQASDGQWCDSRLEAARWEELLLLQKAGTIRDLLPHPSFALFSNGTRVGRYSFDSLYVEAGRLVAEELKSKGTATNRGFRTRLKVFQANFPHIMVKLIVR